MKRLLLDFLWSHLRSLGAFRSEQPVGAAREAAGLLPVYDLWFAEAVRVLEVEGYLERRGDRVLVRRTAPDRSFDELWREWEAQRPGWRDNPDLAAIHVLVETTLRELPDVLTGKRRATDVMFPGGSVELVEAVYKSNPESVFFNRVLAGELVAHLRRRAEAEPGFQPRILEIGAGTGATSAAVLAALDAAGTSVREYRYTDLSRAFLDHAERSYGPGRPFLAYGILDIERSPAEQGIDVGGYDVVIAANVLHATRNIRATLRNAKVALKSGGVLLLNEVTANTFLNQFTFGLLEGWWRYDDAESRITGSPILSVDGWRQVLAEEGFGPISLPAWEAADLGQQIIVAGSNGVVRQRGDRSREPARQPVPVRAAEPRGAARGRDTAVPAGDGPADRLLAHVEAVAVDVLAEALRIDRARIGRTEPFSDFGIDSIFAVQVARTLGAELGLDLDVTLLFEYGTVAELGEFIVGEHADALSAALADEAASHPVEVRQREDPADVAEPGDALDAEPDGIAIVGISARFPRADDVEEFWRIVEQGERRVTTPPLGREDWVAYRDAVDTTGMWGGFLDGVHEFDPLFFSLSMTEARQLPPELRLMLMTAWNAIEDAGYRPAELRARPTGVFIAATPTEYRADSPEMLLPSPVMIPNRISYLFDLHGPSEQSDTRCSSSLVALHRAIRSIRDGECEQALVGGVNLTMSPAGFEVMRAGGMLTTSGAVRPFQEGAEGTARGEGVCAVLVKPLRAAVEDGDFVYGVVRGTAVAHGGKGVSFTAPNIRGMKSAITRAYADAGVDPGSVAYVEAHGMSSLLADGAEIAALRASLRGDADTPGDDGSVTYLGSLKPVFGHTEVVSGLAALVKVVQALRHGVIPAIPGFGRPHPDLSLDGTRLRLASENLPWPVRTDDDGRVLPRRASINSFGIGGVNAHAVLEQYVPRTPARAEDVPSPQVLVLSAKTEDGLRERVRRLVGRLRGTESFADIAYTLQVGREPMACRLALVATTGDEAADVLYKWLGGDPEARSRVAFADDVRRAGPSDDDGREAAEGNLKILADRWVAGAAVDWEVLHEGSRRRRVPLPGYPFQREVCFIPQTPAPDTVATAPVRAEVGATRPDDFVTGLVASVLGLEEHVIDRTRPLADYGLNSLLLTGVLSRVRGAFPAFQPDWLQVHDTVDDVVARLSAVAGDGTAAGAGFPELVHLNGVAEGRPVFWVHGALASVETYRTIAARVDRPFYGIQARGFLTEQEPVEGIPAMAEHYLDIIRSVQPEGPYDIGGFCLGGIVSYEMTRLLQSRGEVVRSLVMVDSPDVTGWAKSNGGGSATARSAALQVVNSLLWPAGVKGLDEVRPRLIHQDDVAGAPDDDAAFVRLLADLAVERGLSLGREQVAALIERNIAIQLAYRIGEFEIRPLADPDAVDATYFRNARGLFIGELTPYFQVVGETFSLDHVNYRQDWERELPGLRVVDLDAANHMTLMHEPDSLAAVEETCVRIYAAD
ncbi:beta-ketoacyl synthase N-terminal-like domain-containing protein [Saccharothrix hoggarensis]|uniref:Beta-ketoacyl synthase N-terminal-like domain-containing protein n=1 Tax=Saccharothrix hoggarensis TaxID=913853 RepID=A0ABW3QY91_9PSEU